MYAFYTLHTIKYKHPCQQIVQNTKFLIRFVLYCVKVTYNFTFCIKINM